MVSRDIWREYRHKSGYTGSLVIEEKQVSRITPEFLILAISWMIILFALGEKKTRVILGLRWRRRGEKKHNFIFSFRYNGFYLSVEALRVDI